MTQAIGKIHAAMIAVMSEVGVIPKDKTNQQQKFKYRGIDDVYAALHHIMAKHGVYSTSEILNVQREERQSKSGGLLCYSILTIRYRFYAADGSSVTTDVIGEALDSGDKASNKSMSIAHKYALLQTFCIPTEDLADPDAESHDIKSREKERADQAAQELEANLRTAETDLVSQTDMDALKGEFARWFRWAKPLGEGPANRVHQAYEKRKRELTARKEVEPA